MASKMKVTWMTGTISTAWFAFARHAERFDELHKALDESRRIEKEHRAMGKRFTRGQAGYRLPVEVTARFFVLLNTFRSFEVPKDWCDFAGFRRDIVLCQALRERLFRDGKLDAAFPDESFAAIDYAADIAA